MAVDTFEWPLSVTVPPAGQVVVAYPTGRSAADYGSAGHRIWANETVYLAPQYLTVTFGPSDVTINWIGPGSLIAGQEIIVGLALAEEVPATGATEFTQLTDTPADYSGQGGKAVAVNVAGDALEFTDFPASGSSLDIQLDETNFSMGILGTAGASYIETGNTGVTCLSGTSSFPNRVGTATETPQGTDYDGTHVAGALWKAADSSYVAGAAEYCGSIGGYDCVVNQIGGWISGSNHSMLAYHANGHSYISGGGYNFINTESAAIIGGTASAIIGTSQNSTIIGCREGLIDSAVDCLLIGRDSTINSNASRSMAVGNNVEVLANHQNSILFGQDADSPGADSFCRGADQMSLRNDTRVWSKVTRRRTTDATIRDPYYNGALFAAGGVYAGYIKVKVIALRDGGVNGADDGNFGYCALEAETSFMWDEDNNQGSFNGAASASSPNFSLTPVGIDGIGVGACTINLSTGQLRVRVQAPDTTPVNWVVEMEVVSTCVASAT